MADATNRDRATNHRGRLAGLAALLVLLTIPALPTMRLDQMPAARAAQDVMHVPLGAAVVLVLHAVLGGFRRRLFVSLMFAGAALVSLELVQGVLATGQPSWGDVFLDALGMAWAVALVGIRGRTTGGAAPCGWPCWPSWPWRCRRRASGRWGAARRRGWRGFR
jgi:hypothetical protein